MHMVSNDDGETHTDLFREMGPSHFQHGDDTVAAARTLMDMVTRAISGYMHGPAVFQTQSPTPSPLHFYVCVSALFFTCDIYRTHLTIYIYLVKDLFIFSFSVFRYMYVEPSSLYGL